MRITSGKIPCAQKVVIYGPEGIGKSTLAAQFPEPLFIDTEGSTRQMDVRRFDPPGSWTMLLEQVRYVKATAGLCKTLVIDTADWAEMLCVKNLCAKYQKKGVEDFGYGKGYVFLGEEWGGLLNLLSDVTESGIHVVLTAHAKMRKFEQPDEAGAYDRWELKLSKITAPLTKEWADLLLFANYKTFVVNVDGQGADRGKNKAQGGKRVLYTAHHPCWDAKNRCGLPEELELSYRAIAPCIEGALTPKKSTVQHESSAIVGAGGEEGKAPAAVEIMPFDDPPSGFSEPAADPIEQKAPPAGDPELSAVPAALRALMDSAGVSLAEVKAAVASRGYWPADTPFDRYDPGFVQGVLIGAWEQVLAMILSLRAQQQVPF